MRPACHAAADDSDADGIHLTTPSRAMPTCKVVADLLPHENAGFAGAFLPRENADRHDSVEAESVELGEKGVPIHLTLADVQVLVHPSGRPGRVDDVPETG